MTPEILFRDTYTNPTSFHIYFATAEKDSFTHIPEELRKQIEIKAKQDEFKGGKSEILHLEQISQTGIMHVVVLGVGVQKGDTTRIIRDQVIKAVRLARRVRADKVGIHIDAQDTIQAVVEGVLLGDYSIDIFKHADHTKKHPHIKQIYLITPKNTKAELLVKKGIHIASANMLARDLVNMPGSHAYPEILAQYAKKIETSSQGLVTVQVLEEDECRKLGMGSFLSVGQGSDKKSQFIVLHYRGSGKKKFALVGKSITFDSGGLSLKPGEHMMDMKIDMAGGAAVLGVFSYLAAQRPTISSFSDIYGVLPAAENMISGSATKPGDIVKAMNGKTIEILNTDAEGRLVLADALVYAETVLKADYIIDIATLTGACAVALGNDLAGLFTNNDELEKQFGVYAAQAGDDYWKMPLHESYASQMKSTIADLKNIGGGRYGGAITAALFLKEFVKKSQWMHIDIAGPAYSEKLGASGWGVVSVIYFLEQITKV